MLKPLVCSVREHDWERLTDASSVDHWECARCGKTDHGQGRTGSVPPGDTGPGGSTVVGDLGG